LINGAGHWYGYRNFESADASTNIVPVGILIGGEELHNNHHAFASSAKFSNKRWEFDLGWQYIRLLSVLSLAKVKKLAPTPRFNNENPMIDYDTVSAVISNRWHVMSDYAHEVIGDVYKDEMRKANVTGKKLLRRGKKLMSRADSLLDSNARQRLDSILAHSDTLNVVYEFKQRLQEIWLEKTATRESMVQNLQEWCRQAEATGIEALEEFSRNIRAYTLQPIPA
jgi:stearoyl-CoA desaturase (delta-9 desaturase)